MPLPDDIRTQLAELERVQRRLGIVTVKVLREVLPKRINDLIQTSELATIANQINSMREDVTPILGQDVKSKQAGDVL